MPEEIITRMDEENPRKPLSGRYIGSLVADFHRNLLEGGVFYYPQDYKDPSKPQGKLRLLYEAAPLAFIAEHAGGYASDGRRPILDIVPETLHRELLSLSATGTWWRCRKGLLPATDDPCIGDFAADAKRAGG